MAVKIPPRPKKNGVSLRIWEIAEDITENLGREATKSSVMDRAARESIDQGTANKQYYDWRKSYRSKQGGALEGFNEAPVAPLYLHLQIGADGRILIPAEMRRAMKIETGGQLNAELVDGELRLTSPAVALEKLQNLFAPLRKGPSLVDELLAERRTEAARE